jgi:hypothetical protein
MKIGLILAKLFIFCSKLFIFFLKKKIIFLIDYNLNQMKIHQNNI